MRFGNGCVAAVSLRLFCLFLPLASAFGSANFLDVNVAGTWNITVESPQGTGTPTVVLKQDGEKLTGTYKGRVGEAQLEGTLKGSEIKFSITVTIQDQKLTITYSGIVDKDAMKGSAQFGDLATGTWTAKRKVE